MTPGQEPRERRAQVAEAGRGRRAWERRWRPSCPRRRRPRRDAPEPRAAAPTTAESRLSVAEARRQAQRRRHARARTAATSSARRAGTRSPSPATGRRRAAPATARPRPVTASAVITRSNATTNVPSSCHRADRAHQPDERLPGRPARLLDRGSLPAYPPWYASDSASRPTGSGHRYGSSATNATKPRASNPAIGQRPPADPRRRAPPTRRDGRRPRAPQPVDDDREAGDAVQVLAGAGHAQRDGRRDEPRAAAARRDARPPRARRAARPRAGRGTPGPPRASPGSCT